MPLIVEKLAKLGRVYTLADICRQSYQIDFLDGEMFFWE